MRWVGVFTFLFASLCCAQESGDFKPAATNVSGADFPRVDSASRAQFRVKAPDAAAVKLNFWSGPKLDMAKQFGATATLLAKPGEDPVKPIKKLTDGGADFAFECVGSGELSSLSFRALGRGGLAVVVGVAKPNDMTAVRTMTLPFEEKTLTGSLFGSCVPRIDFPRMLALYMAGRLKLDELITHRYTIDEAPQAFADLVAGKNARGIIEF